MKSNKFIYLFLFLIPQILTLGQNQVINPSFETFDNAVLTPMYPVFDQTVLGYLPAPWQQRLSCDLFIKGNEAIPIKARTGIVNAGFAATADNGVPTVPYREIPIGATNVLSAGTQYKIEFWVKRRDGNTDIKLGAFMSTTAFPCITSCSPPVVTPNIENTILGSNHQYTKVFGFWTPPVTSNYFIHIGNFRLTSVEGVQINYFFLDDVSVTPCSAGGTPNPIVNIGNNVFCENNPVVVDASTSTNIDDYKWELSLQSGTLIKEGEWQVGNPTFLNVNTFANLLKGNCYRLKLITYKGCTRQDAFVDFCIENPNVNLTLSGNNPYCEGETIDITATGDNGWTYSWSTGQSGVGLKNISVVADENTSNYSVTVTTTAGCTSISSVNNLNVQTNSNIAPTTNGVNNSGGYTFFIKAGTNGCFDVPTFDAANEQVTISVISSLPSSATFQPIAGNHQIGNFCWTPTFFDVGSHPITVRVQDNNSCGELWTDYTFTVNVICEFCPIDVYYENRQPGNNPLPAETEAGRLIVAGNSVDPSQADGVVETGNTPVLFKAGEGIILEPGFTGGINFTTQIDPSTCLDPVDCLSCCNDWNGFTFDFIPNVFTPNGDGINDVWYVPDSQHPYCAFNIQGFTLQIYNRWNLLEYELDHNAAWYQCCFYKSPPASYPLPHSYIFWNGINNSGNFSHNDVYFYALNLRGCGHSQDYTGFIHIFGSPSGIIIDDSTGVVSKSVQYDDTDYVMLEREDLIKFILPQQEEVTTNMNEITALESKLMLYPNPTKDKINISLSNNKVIQNGLIELFTLQGKLLLSEKINSTSATIDVALFAKGTYFIKLTEHNIAYRQLFIKD